MTVSAAKHTILIIDDVADNIQVISTVLYQHGLNVAMAQSGAEALRILDSRTPDLILLDVKMPDMDGFEVCRCLKARRETRDIPIIFLTAKTEPEHVLQGFHLGAVDYIAKPFQVAEVAARVLAHLDVKIARDRMQRENRQRQLLLYNTIEALPHPFYVINVADYTVQLANAASQAAEAAGIATCYSLTHHRETPCGGADHPCPLRDVVRTCRPVSVEHRHFDAAGQLRYVEIHGYPMFDEHDRITQIIEYAIDVTERRETEQALRASEAQYRTLAEHVADGIGIIQDGGLVFVNHALAAMLGTSPEAMAGKSPEEFFQSPSPEDFQKLCAASESGAAEAQGWPVLQCVMNSAQQELWMEGRHSAILWGGRSAVLMTMRDITKRKLREIAIEEERNTLRRENRQLRSSIKERYRFGRILGKSYPMQEVYELILKAAASEQDVLIYGESGTGKELVATTIHHYSPRQRQPFVPVNCGAIPETLCEREFFGHQKGTFTGAHQSRGGFFEAADRGSLFLDEVGELPLSMQVKLLRAIENGEYTPVGGTQPKRGDVRIISATHRDLPEMVKQGLMREDFFYRLHVIVITLPPLRERREDIPLLIDHFLRERTDSDSPPTLPGHVLEALYSHNWPGNIRQLQHTLSRYLTVGRLDFISPHPRALPEPEPDEIRFQEAVEAFEKRLLKQALNRHHWNQTQTADSLGMTRQRLLRRMARYDLKPDYVS